MRFPTLVLPGRCEDALLYMGHLFLFMEDWSLRVSPLDALTATIQTSRAELAPLPRILFERNDWMALVSTREMLDNAEIRSSFGKVFDRYPMDALVLNQEDPDQVRFGLGFEDNVLLDVLIYAQRLYMASDSGLHHMDLEFTNEVESASRPARRLDARTQTVSAGYGTVNASCGEFGLFSAFDDFGWLSRSSVSELQQVAPMSARTEWLGRGSGLVNYKAAASAPTLLRSGRERTDRSPRGSDRHVITELREEESFEHLVSDLLTSQDVMWDDVSYMFNSQNTIFAQVRGRGLLTAALSHIDTHPKARAVRIHDEEQGRPLSLHTAAANTSGRTDAALVIEQENAVQVLIQGRMHTIHDGPVLSVRSYPKSKRYRNLVSVVAEDHVSLIALITIEE